MKRLFIILISLSFLVSCQHTKEEERKSITLDHTLLLMPPIGNDKEDYLKTLGVDCWSELNLRTNGGAVYASNIRALKESLNNDNLTVDGRIDKAELISIASTLKCGSAISIQVIKRESLPPQRLVLRLDWLNVNGDQKKTKVYDLNLESPYERERFKEYIRYNEDAKHILDRWRNRGNKFDIETAWLSPSIFNKYVAYRTINDFVTAPEPELKTASGK